MRASERNAMIGRMVAWLANKFKGQLDTSDSYFDHMARVAIRYFACHYHDGQWSDLYAVQCGIKYEPSPFENGPEDVGEDCQMLYEALVEEHEKNGLTAWREA